MELIAFVAGTIPIVAGVFVFYYFGKFLEEEGVNKVVAIVLALAAGVLTWYLIGQWVVPAFVVYFTPN